MSALRAGPVFDPYKWPSFDKDSSVNVLMHMINGLSVYEACMCLETYLSICTKAKLKTWIFRLMTVAVIGHISSMVLNIMDLNNLGRNDVIVGDSEIAAAIISYLLNVTARISYYVAATMRSRALLSKKPKLLWSFYVLLVVCILNNLAAFGLFCDFLSILHDTPPQAFLKNLPKIMNAIKILQNENCACAAFDTAFSYVLMVTFLYPIYKNLQMEFRSVFLVLVKLGDVQKALVVCASAALAAATMFSGMDGRLSISAAGLCALTQDTMFLRVSYKTTGELITRGSLGSSNMPSKSGGHAHAASALKTKINYPHPSGPASTSPVV